MLNPGKVSMTPIDRPEELVVSATIEAEPSAELLATEVDVGVTAGETAGVKDNWVVAGTEDPMTVKANVGDWKSELEATAVCGVTMLELKVSCIGSPVLAVPEKDSTLELPFFPSVALGIELSCTA